MDPKQANKQNMKDLEAQLLGLDKPELKAADKRRLKNALMASLHADSIAPFTAFERDMVQNFEDDLKPSLPLARRALIKERVLEMVNQDLKKSLFWSNFWSFSRRFAGAMMVLVISFGYVAILNVQVGVVYASKLTTLVDFEDVMIERDGMPLVVYRGMEIEENDRISTGVQGKAVIKYFDDSVTRLAPDTKVKVSKLMKNPENESKGHVGIEVEDGAVWSKVLNLVDDDSSFVVEFAEVKAFATRGAFNVEVEDQEFEVEVYNHTVDLEAEGKKSKVLSGEKVVVDLQFQSVKEKRKLIASEKDNDWVKQNIEEDKKHLKLVETEALAAGKESLGDDPTIKKKGVKEKALLLLTFDDLKAAQIALEIAEKNFVAAQVKLYDDALTAEDLKAVKLAFAEFAKQIENFNYLIVGVREKDPKYAKELEIYLDSKIALRKEFLAALGPESPAYMAKKVLDDAEFETAEEDEKVEVKKRQVEEKLILAEEAADSGDAKAASKALKEFETEAKKLVEIDREVEELVATVKEEVEVAEVQAIEKLLKDAEEFGVETDGDKALDPLLKGY